MKKLLSLCLSIILLLSVGGIVVAGGEEPADESSAPVIQKPVHVTITDELDNFMSGVTVEVTDAEGNVVGTYESVDGALTAFLEKGTYTLTITGVPEGYCVTTDPVTIDVTLTETEQEFDIRAGTISDTDPDHELFCNHNPSHLESYRVRDNGEEIVGYCFNQNYDPPSFDAEDCTYKRLVGTPELLYELAQSKLEGITPQELYDHVLSMIYHRDDIQEKYGLDDMLTNYLVNMAIKNFTDGDMDSFKTTDEDGNNLVVREYYPRGPVVYDEEGYYQFQPGGSILGSIVGHANGCNGKNPDYVFPQAVKDAWHELITLTDHPADYYLYIYYPDNFMTKEEGIANGWSVPAHYRNLYYADAYQCLMTTFEVEPIRAMMKISQTTEIEVTKIWDDENDHNGRRPESITVNLLADGKPVQSAKITPDADGNWVYTFRDLPKHADGKEIVYTITEEPVEAYVASIEGFQVTNSFTPPTGDAFSPGVWMTLLAVSLLAVPALLLLRRKRDR